MNIFYNPVKIIQGFGATQKLVDIEDEAIGGEGKILFLVWSKKVLENEGIKNFYEKNENRIILKEITFSNPEVGQLFEIYSELKSENVRLVVAVGGGSVLDTGKSLCTLFGEDLKSVDELRTLIAEKKYKNPICKWFGLPTTAGTGSEVTCWATVWDSEKYKKYSIELQQNYAYAAFADPDLIKENPVSLAVSCGLDAVCHATESYWARSTNGVSRLYALRAIKLLVKNLENLLDGKNKDKACAGLSLGSLLAGMAFSNTHTTACHSISYPLTMKCHIPHGTACSLLLGPVFKINLPNVKKSENLLKAFGVEKVEQIEILVKKLLKKAGIKNSLKEWGVDENQLKDLASHSITKGRADNNPVDLTEKEIFEILKSIY